MQIIVAGYLSELITLAVLPYYETDTIIQGRGNWTKTPRINIFIDTNIYGKSLNKQRKDNPEIAIITKNTLIHCTLQMQL